MMIENIIVYLLTSKSKRLERVEHQGENNIQTKGKNECDSNNIIFYQSFLKYYF